MALPRSFLAGLLLLAAATLHARTFEGTVTHVSDGDTLWVRPLAGGRPVPVRLHGLDAPERCQAGGPQARDALSARVMRRPVRVVVLAEDDYGRLVARVERSGRDVGAGLVTEGHAWSVGWRRAPGPYDTQQARARQARRGVWAQHDPVPPRVFRRQHGPCR